MPDGERGCFGGWKLSKEFSTVKEGEGGMTKPNKFEIEKDAGFEGFLFFFFADGLPPIKKKREKSTKRCSFETN